MKKFNKDSYVHEYKGFNIVKCGTKEFPYNIYKKDEPTCFGTWVGFGKTIKMCKNDIDDGCFDEENKGD